MTENLTEEEIRIDSVFQFIAYIEKTKYLSKDAMTDIISMAQMFAERLKEKNNHDRKENSAGIFE